MNLFSPLYLVIFKFLDKSSPCFIDTEELPPNIRASFNWGLFFIKLEVSSGVVSALVSSRGISFLESSAVLLKASAKFVPLAMPIVLVVSLIEIIFSATNLAVSYLFEPPNRMVLYFCLMFFDIFCRALP